MSARERVQAFLSARGKIRLIDHQVIESLDGGKFALTTADLRSLLEQRPARLKGNMRYADWDVIEDALMRYQAHLERMIEAADEDSTTLRESREAYQAAGRALKKVSDRVQATHPDKDSS